MSDVSGKITGLLPVVVAVGVMGYAMKAFGATARKVKEKARGKKEDVWGF